ncbi:hypothetical protein M673_16055 [Aureimonas sp. AU20]|nr:hypothetical protein M673_16055 [Aureimonas sp. AU20]
MNTMRPGGRAPPERPGNRAGGPCQAFEGTRVADQEQAELRLQLARLRQEHMDFDLAINAMESTGCDRLAVQRMKKKKLAIKDRLQDIEDQVIPDLTA